MKFKYISKYSFFGILNTLLHWGVFYMLISQSLPQSTSNLISFFTAATFSFFVNAKYTFKSNVNIPRYLSFVGFMGGIAYITGLISDSLSIPGYATLIIFSAISFVVGFFVSKNIIFKVK